LTSPPSDQPRARSGLAKLRGQVEEPLAGSAALEPDPAAPQASAPSLGEASSGGVVTLTKPDRVIPADTDAATKTETEADGPAAGKRRVGRRAIAALVALVVAIVVLVPLVLINPFDSTTKSSTATGPGSGSGGTPAERLAVVRAARQFTVSFFTYDYRKIDTYLRRIEAASTGAFRKDFVSKESTLKTVVTQLKTVATGEVPDNGAGLFQLNGDNATVLVAANLNATNAVTKNGQQRYRVKIALQLVKGTWLVTNLDEVV
jgi:hypothetical protein